MDTLPPALLPRILSVLPVISRACAACVCRGWRDALADPAQWTLVDLSDVAAEKKTPAFVQAAAARAGGQMHVLDLGLKGSNAMCFDVGYWKEIIEAYGPTLRTLRLGNMNVAADLAWITVATPQLKVLEAGIYGSCADIASALRKKAPFGVLRATCVFIDCREDRKVLLDVAAALAVHPSVREVTLGQSYYAHGVVDAFLDVAAKHRISGLTVEGCDIFVKNTAALARLLHNGSLRTLCASIRDYAIDDKIEQLQDAFGACSKLTDLTLQVYFSRRGDLAHVLDVVATIPALQFLKVSIVWPDEYEEDDRQSQDKALGRALGVLLARDIPSLHTLEICGCGLGDAALYRVLAGLSSNTHLRKLEKHFDSSKEFMHDFLEPALKALAARPERSAQF